MIVYIYPLTVSMPQNKNNLPKQIKLGKSPGAQPKGVLNTGGKGINTNLPEIHWTRGKLIIVTTILAVPYTAAIAVAFGVGNNLIGGLLVAIALFVWGMYFLLRYLENADL